MVSDEVTYDYDNGPFALGKLTKVHHLTGSKEFTYDGGQRLTKTRIATFSNAKDFTTTYNQLSQEIESTYPDGTKMNKEYDREGRVVKMKVDGKDVFTGAIYDKFGNQRVAQVQFQGTQYTNTNDFDTLGRLKVLGVSKKAAAFGVGIVDQDLIKQNLNYNDYSEIDTLDETVSGQTTLFDYGYDGFSQLTSVKSPLYNTSYEYDLFGRILKKQEKDNVVMKYSSTYPFFAPKTVEVTGEEQTDVQPTTSPTPAVPTATLTPVPLPTKGPVEQALGLTTRSYDIGYTNEGGMKNDENNCYRYNREGELIFLGIKKNKKGMCSDDNFKKIYMFYYDEGGAMNLQEEYDPANLQKPTKQIYLFGQYEEEVTN
jgi:YD repeat-containing protein